MSEVTELQALVLLILIEAGEGGLNAEEIAAEISRRTGVTLSVEELIATLDSQGPG